MDDRLERNKNTAMAFYNMMFNQNSPREAIEQYAGEKYIQHNPQVPDGKAGFIEYFERINQEYPDKRVHFIRSIAEGDYVVLHTRQEWPGYRDWASMDIFRFDKNGKIVEHWDVLQEMPETFAHDNGMF